MFFLSGVWINLLTEILYLAKRLVISDNTPGLSFTSNLKYNEFVYLSLLNGLINLLLLEEIPKGYLVFPLKIDNKSDNNEEEVGPGPAPSPCKTLSPTGLPSVIYY